MIVAMVSTLPQTELAGLADYSIRSSGSFTSAWCIYKAARSCQEQSEAARAARSSIGAVRNRGAARSSHGQIKNLGEMDGLACPENPGDPEIQS